MFSVDYVAGSSNGASSWIEILVMALVLALMGFVGVRSLAAAIVGRIRRSDLASAAVVSEIVSSIVRGDDGDVAFMRVAYELTALLGLADCRWAIAGDEVPVGVLEDDGSIQFGTFRWPIEREGLPPRGVRRELIVDGERFGSVVLIPGSPNPVPQERLAAAATTIDVLALGIAEHRIGSRPGSGA